MGEITRHVSAWDGLPLLVREWHGGDRPAPLLCLPGLVRTGGDFAALAPLIGAGRRMVAVDYAGRGGSGRAAKVGRYAPEACLRDVLDICAALHLHEVVVIGTSFGGLLACALAAARPSLLRAVVMNDVGPEVGTAGAGFVRTFVGMDPALESLDACIEFLRARLPPLSLSTDAAWREMATLTYAPGPDGRFHPLWDTRIAQLLTVPAPDLWPLFGAVAHLPLLLAWGEVSTILLPETVSRMRAARPDMDVISLPGIGHAPTLTEPDVVVAIQRFLDRVG